MKKLSLLVIILLILTFYVYADNQLSVRFHSFGKNATINLKEFIGESEQYIASKSNNIRIIIDQEKGIAKLYARPGWVGSETVVFTSIEKASNITNQTLLDMLKTAEEFKYVITTKEINEIIKDNLDKKLKNRIKEIHKEEIKKIYSKIENKELLLSLNDEVNFKINLAEKEPIMDIEFITSKETTKTIVIPDIKEKFDISWVLIPSIVILSLIAIAIIISKREDITKKFRKIELKRNTIKKLRKIKKYDRKASREFLITINNFFADFFDLRYDFEFEELKKNIKKSDLKIIKKIKLIYFINELSNIIFYSNTEKWAKVYGKGTIPPEKLEKLIKRSIRLIKNL
jgi:hypothetical protein